MNIKKYHGLLLVFVMLLCLTLAFAACDGKSDDTPATDTTVADTTAADSTAADATAADTTVADTPATDTTVADTTVADTTAADTTAADTIDTQTELAETTIEPEETTTVEPETTTSKPEETTEPETQVTGEQTLKIMSFNVQTENGASVDINTRARMLKTLINERMPDSIGMQEVTATWRAKMDSVVFDKSIYAGVGVARTTNASLGLEQCAIYYRKDKYVLVDSGTFWLSDTPDVVGSTFEGSEYPRICTWVRLRDRVTGFEYVHLNTHLHHKSGTDGNTIRKDQIKVLLNFVQTLGDVPMVMTGDFNQRRLNSGGEEYGLYKLITGASSVTTADGGKFKAPFEDVRIDATDTVSPDEWASMTKYHDPADAKYDPSNQPIDFIFYTDAYMTAKVYENIQYKVNGLLMSDHLPQYAELTYVAKVAK